MFADTYESIVSLAPQQVTGNIASFVKYLTGNYMGDGRVTSAIMVERAPYIGDNFLVVRSEWLSPYIRRELK